MNLTVLTKFLECLENGMQCPEWTTSKSTIVENAKQSLDMSAEEYQSIFVVVDKDTFCEGDLNRLKYMVVMAGKVQKNEVTEHDASVEVGTVLVDDFVKPCLKQ